MAALTLLCTTDLHGRLTRAAAQRLRALRQERQALLVDCGDAVTAPNVLVWPWTEQVLTRMNEAGYQAMAAGNREFFFRYRGLLRKTVTATFPVLAANLTRRDGQPALSSHVILTSAGGDRVGCFGLMREMICPGAALEAFSDLRFQPWQEIARAQVEDLRSQVDWLVALSHLGPETDEELAALCPELDLLLSGHGHPARVSLRRVGLVTLVTPAPYLREVVYLRSRGDTSPSEFSLEAIKL
ncbi:MAG: hypothetical protein GX100_00095 [candidate division WS1 bacterium]|jgi:2',3'-cyclic-nucleotide 2'-phosphodiesterase (5'-nucleotidase family)|nr:hypothetical protein [candidate division WS1 bacterium]